MSKSKTGPPPAISDAELDRQMKAATQNAATRARIEPRAVALKINGSELEVTLESGWRFAFDPARLDELKRAAPTERTAAEIKGAGYTLGWDRADVHIGVGAIIIELLGEKYVRSEVSRMRGKIKTARRAQASAENGKLGGRPKGKTKVE